VISEGAPAPVRGAGYRRSAGSPRGEALTRPDIRRDTVRLLRAAAADSRFLITAADRLPGFTQPALVVWAEEDRVMPPEHGRRLAGLLPQGRLAEVADSYTLIPLDQPAQLAGLIREFSHAAVGA
jgi:pimeloyl-ACP methyl ester carboxylesterase